MTISYFLLTLLYLVLVLVLTPLILSGLHALDETPKGQLLSNTGWTILNALSPKSTSSLGALIPICGSLGFQMFCNRRIFFIGKPGNQWLRYAFLCTSVARDHAPNERPLAPYCVSPSNVLAMISPRSSVSSPRCGAGCALMSTDGIFDYNLIYTNALLGVAVAVTRFIVLFSFFVLFIARLDKTTMPGPTGNFNKLDPGFKCYIAVVRMDHRYNNAIFLTFGDIVLERLRAVRATAHLRAVRRKFVLAAFDKKAGALPPQEDLPRRPWRLAVRLWAFSVTEAEMDRKLARARIMRNRWQLAWRCMQQPYLLRWRQDAMMREALKAMGETGGKEAIVNFGLKRIQTEQVALNALMTMQPPLPMMTKPTSTPTSPAAKPTSPTASKEGTIATRRSDILEAMAARNVPRLEDLLSRVPDSERGQLDSEMKAANVIIDLLKAES